jgi:chloride channel 7
MNDYSKPNEPRLNGRVVESRDTIAFESAIYRDRDLDSSLADLHKENLWSWVLTGLVGAGTAVLGALVTFGVLSLLRMKMNFVFAAIARDEPGLGFLYLLFLNILFTLLASLLCYWIPPAAGSGIPEVCPPCCFFIHVFSLRSNAFSMD